MALASIKLGDIAGVVRGFREVIRVGGREELVSEAKSRLDNLERTVVKLNGFSLDTYLKNSDTFDKAFTALQNREFGSAISLFKRVLETDPKHVQSWGNLGLAYASIGEKGKALECLDKALELDPEYEIAAVNRIGIEKMGDGERLEAEIDSVNYYRDYKVRGKKSYIAETIGNLFKKGLEE
jgi:tetratricopeptide (TPR) repeat protein